MTAPSLGARVWNQPRLRHQCVLDHGGTQVRRQAPLNPTKPGRHATISNSMPMDEYLSSWGETVGGSVLITETTLNTPPVGSPR